MSVVRAIAAVGIALIFGCASDPLPARWGTLDEAFPGGADLRVVSDAPMESQQRATFAAPFEDVYRATLVSLSQAQYNVSREDKRKGVLAGMRVMQIPPGQGINVITPTERRYFVAVVVQERGPKLTEVLALAKAQGRCVPDVLPSQVERCRAYSRLHWASGNTSASQDLNNLMTFVRNNLVAAGVL